MFIDRNVLLPRLAPTSHKALLYLLKILLLYHAPWWVSSITHSAEIMDLTYLFTSLLITYSLTDTTEKLGLALNITSPVPGTY